MLRPLQHEVLDALHVDLDESRIETVKCHEVVDRRCGDTLDVEPDARHRRMVHFPETRILLHSRNRLDLEHARRARGYAFEDGNLAADVVEADIAIQSAQRIAS